MAAAKTSHPYFAGKVVIVTGSSNGIGRVAARIFAENGAKVTIHGRDQNALTETHKLLVSVGAKESDILEVSGELTDDATAHKIVDQTIAKFGTVHILINNAGASLEKAGEGMTPNNLDAFDKTIHLNTRSVILVTELCMPHIVKNKGEVVNVSSIAALKYHVFAPYYGIAKAALDQLTVQQATIHIREGVRVNGVNPGWIDTTFMQKRGVTADQQKTLIEKFGNVVPVGYVADPEHIARVIAFLADRNESAYIVGQSITADGGATLELAMMEKMRDGMRELIAAQAAKKN